MPIARIADGLVAELRDIGIEDVPAQKRAAWKPVEGEAPAFDQRIETRTGPVYQIEEGRVLREWSKQPRDLATVKAEFTERLENDAEALRLRYVTAGAGMAMTYAEKKDQALAVLDLGKDAAHALPDNGEGQFPLLAASVGVEAVSLYEAAEIVMVRYEAWVVNTGAIESKRLQAKKAINEAADVHAVKAAYEAVSW